MRWKNVHVEAIAHVIPDEKISSAELESRLSPMYSALHLAPGQLESLTGIRTNLPEPLNPVSLQKRPDIATIGPSAAAALKEIETVQAAHWPVVHRQ